MRILINHLLPIVIKICISLAFSVIPAWIKGDSWYSGHDNLKFIRKLNTNFLFGIENNRLISTERGKYIQIQTSEGWPHEGKSVYLKDRAL